jgi:hypothetical protein
MDLPLFLGLLAGILFWFGFLTYLDFHPDAQNGAAVMFSPVIVAAVCFGVTNTLRGVKHLVVCFRTRQRFSVKDNWRLLVGVGVLLYVYLAIKYE